MSLTDTADISGAPPGLIVTRGQGEGVAPRPAPLASAGGRTIALTRARTVVIVKIRVPVILERRGVSMAGQNVSFVQREKNMCLETKI